MANSYGNHINNLEELKSLRMGNMKLLNGN